jgi:hypothetical protein
MLGTRHKVNRPAVDQLVLSAATLRSGHEPTVNQDSSHVARVDLDVAPLIRDGIAKTTLLARQRDSTGPEKDDAATRRSENAGSISDAGGETSRKRLSRFRLAHSVSKRYAQMTNVTRRMLLPSSRSKICVLPPCATFIS